MDDRELEGYVHAWLNWCNTRRFYLPAAQKNVLSQFLPSKTGLPPNARNYPDMQFFNMAIHSLADTDKHGDDYKAFYVHYCGDPQVVKRRASALGIAPRTYYDRVRRFVRAAYAMSGSLRKAHDATNGVVNGAANGTGQATARGMEDRVAVCA